MYLYFVVLVCALGLTQTQAGTLSAEEKQKLMGFGIDCLKESGCDPEVLKEVVKGEFPDKPDFKEYLWCIHKKTHMQDENGKIQKDVIIPYMKRILKDDKKVDEVVAKCLVEKDTPQNTAWEMAKCSSPYVPKEDMASL